MINRWAWILRYLKEADVDWSDWALNGTQARGTGLKELKLFFLNLLGRRFGAEEEFGVLNTSWTGIASQKLLKDLQSIQKPKPIQ